MSEPRGDYLHRLHTAERLLPDLLDDRSHWKGLDVLYHAPRVERVWMQFAGGPMRISLHVIHKAGHDECLYHPHPWPSAMRIVHGGYEMGIGYGSGVEAPPEACRVILTAGSEYEMANPDGWHFVCPTSPISLSLMVSGMPWNREMPVEPDKAELPPLSDERIHQILELFKTFYPK